MHKRRMFVPFPTNLNTVLWLADMGNIVHLYDPRPAKLKRLRSKVEEIKVELEALRSKLKGVA
jgi:hypothetical protein